jgi:flavin-binding protein dodecin
VWIILPIFFFLILCWLFIAPLELEIDTRIPRACLRWSSVGRAIVTYQNDTWWLNLRVFFFHKQWDLEKLIFGIRKKKKTGRRDNKKAAVKKTNRAKKFLNVVKTFRVTEWQIAVDTGDVTKNAWLYALNFIKDTRRHLRINFTDENYILLVIRNAPWKLAYAFLKK